MGGKQTKYSNCKHSDSLSYGSPYCPLPQHLSPGNSMNSNGTKFPSRYRRIDDNYSSLDQVKEALAQSGLESSNLIIGIDFTKSNEWMGKHSSNEKSLHHIGEGLNPYQHAISIIGSTLSAFDEDNLIPCFGFGDVTTHDQDVFSFYPDNKPCNGFEEVLSRYREIVPNVRLAGPTSYAPIIETAIGMVDKSGGQYHVLLIIVDGQVTRSVDTSVGQLSPQERSTVEAIVKASNYPLSIVLVGVGDGPWHMMQKFDDDIPARAFDNIQFVNFTEIMVRNVPLAQKEAEFALAALMEIPLQYRATLELQLLSNRRGIPGKAPLQPPSGNFRSSNPPANYFRSSSFEQYYTAFCPPSPTPTGNFSSNRNCPICYWHKRDLAFGCGHQSYIVYLGGHSHGTVVTSDQLNKVADSHHELLGTIIGSKEKVEDTIFYSYNKHINGFAAMLEEEEAAKIAKHPDVVSIFPNRGRNLHTTHSWDFLMLERNGVIHPSSIWKKARFGEDSIIANFDTGVWPESKSFMDNELGPIPSKWKGICQHSDGFTCNRKLIGARYFNKGYAAYGGNITSKVSTARDYDGHGSHTLSTAGGNFVPGANVFGVGNGTAKGGSPKARVATYRVCFPPINDSECFDSDIMKAFDAAIDDGVDVISLSLGGDPSDYFDDGIAIGSFHANRNGVVVVASAGNSGPIPGTVSNTAPWLLTVGASTIDREFQADVKLQNGLYLKGTSLSKPLLTDTFYSLISAAVAKAAHATAEDAILCKAGTLDPKKVKGKILVCLRGENARMEKGEQARLAGAAGMILCNDKTTGNEIIADPHVLPATQINYTDGVALFSYVNKNKNPLGLLTPPKAVVNIKPAPFMASFSSRGPNTVTPEILKPDITAPGVNIIAAYSEGTSPTENAFDTRTTPFITESGTSMSCPHVSGIVGLLKTLYPKWSPAAIKSAIMTTARTRDNTENPMTDAGEKKATPFAYGSGHIRPNRAMNPGLVYDLSVNDYLDFLCGIGYNQTLLSSFTGSNKPYDCPKKYSILNFNYPSITVPNLSGSITVHRKLKNVGTPGIYAVRIRQPAGFLVSVEPNILKFDKIGEEKSFKLKIKSKKADNDGEYVFGELLWSDGKHYVRSPITVS